MAVALMRMDLAKGWTGVASTLLKVIDGLVDESTRKREGWPVDGPRLGRILRRPAPNLRGKGIDVQFDQPRRSNITIRRVPEVTVITDIRTKETPEAGDEGMEGIDGEHDSRSAEPDSNITTDTAVLAAVTNNERGVVGVDRVADDSNDSNDSEMRQVSASLKDGRRRKEEKFPLMRCGAGSSW